MQELDRFQSAAQALREKLGAPGLTAAFVTKSGASGSVGVGFADLERQLPMPSNARMLGGSTGKSFVAATALGLSLDGKLDLDAPLSRALADRPWFASMPNASLLTLRHLLRHIGGVPDHMGDPDAHDRMLARTRDLGPDAYFTPEESVAFLAGRQPLGPPGRAFFYTDTGYILAGIAIEAITGEDLYALIKRVVLGKLGMTATEPSAHRRYEALATPHTHRPEGPKSLLDANGLLPFSPRSEWAGGGFVTSSRDLAEFIHHYAGGTLFSLPYLDNVLEATRYSWGPDHVGAYGLGLFLANSALGPTIGHGGYYPGYRSNMLHFREHGVSVAYQCNSSDSFDSYASIVDKRVQAFAKDGLADKELSVVADPTVDLARALIG